MILQNKLKYIFTYFILLVFVTNSFSQNDARGSWKQKLVFGGNMGFQGGSETRIDFSPEVGYKATERFIVGTGITYEYYRWKLFNYSTSLYGGKLFTKYALYRNIFAQLEYEALSLETKVFDIQNIHSDSGRFWINSVFVGGGFKQPVGDKFAFIATVLWNINDSPDSPYSNPTIRFGFVF